MSTHSYSNSEYESLQSNYNNYVATHHHTDSEYNDLMSIINLQKEEVLRSNYPVSQGAGQLTPVISLPFQYAGYLHIISTSTSSNAYIQVDYWFQGKLYGRRYDVGTSGDIIVPVLKSDSATIYVGNTNWLTGATHTISITYHY